MPWVIARLNPGIKNSGWNEKKFFVCKIKKVYFQDRLFSANERILSGKARYRLFINYWENLLIILTLKFEKTLRRYAYAGVKLLIQWDEVDSCSHV